MVITDREHADHAKILSCAGDSVPGQKFQNQCLKEQASMELYIM